MYTEEDHVFGTIWFSYDDWWRLTWFVVVRIYILRALRLFRRYL